MSGRLNRLGSVSMILFLVPLLPVEFLLFGTVELLTTVLVDVRYTLLLLLTD